MKSVPISLLIISTLFFVSGTIIDVNAQTPDTELLTAGEIRSFTALGETGITYHVYAPDSWKPDVKPPVLITFSPGGNGMGLLEKLKDGVEESGWLLVGCDVLRNGMSEYDQVVRLEDELLNDIFAIIPHDPERIYLGGFSGGGWRAYDITTRRKEPFAGILSYGGWLGGPESQDNPYREGMSIAMINGLNDNGANGWMPIDTASLRDRNCRIKHFTFEGGHTIAPPSVTSAAIAWLDQEWVAKHGEASDEDDGKQRLSILYVGHPGSRADDFTRFLSEHFQSVHASSPEDLTLETINEADVLVIDAVVRTLPEGCTKAMLMIGSNAAMTGERYGSKIDWLCKCLDHEAYLVDTSHPIFTGPIPVTPTLVEKTCPYAELTIQAWKVQEEQDEPGLVASRAHFENAEDSEIIFGGVNMKGIRGVPLLREAHRMLWGFNAPPSEMTPEGQDVFVNSLVWIHDFDGHQQSEFTGIHSRTSIKSVLDSPYTSGEGLLRWFPQELLNETNFDKEEIREYFEGRLPYIYVPLGSGQLHVDEDAERLGTPNNDPESLARWVELLNGDEADIAKQLLLRYTGKRYRNSRQWRGWVEENKDQLEFSDERGYRFYLKSSENKVDLFEDLTEQDEDVDLALSEIAPT